MREINNFLYHFLSKKNCVQEDEVSYTITLEYPGVPKEKINITYNDNVLSVYIFENNEEEKSKYSKKNFFIEDANFENITANYNNGLLVINVLKNPKEKEKKVFIE